MPGKNKEARNQQKREAYNKLRDLGFSERFAKSKTSVKTLEIAEQTVRRFGNAKVAEEVLTKGGSKDFGKDFTKKELRLYEKGLSKRSNSKTPYDSMTKKDKEIFKRAGERGNARLLERLHKSNARDVNSRERQWSNYHKRGGSHMPTEVKNLAMLLNADKAGFTEKTPISKRQKDMLIKLHGEKRGQLEIYLMETKLKKGIKRSDKDKLKTGQYGFAVTYELFVEGKGLDAARASVKTSAANPTFVVYVD